MRLLTETKIVRCTYNGANEPFYRCLLPLDTEVTQAGGGWSLRLMSWYTDPYIAVVFSPLQDAQRAWYESESVWGRISVIECPDPQLAALADSVACGICPPVALVDALREWADCPDELRVLLDRLCAEE